MAEAQIINPCLSKCMSQRRSTYSNRSQLPDCSIRVTDCSIRVYQSFSVICILTSKNLWYCKSILPTMLALCSMLSGIYFAHNYASIIGGSLAALKTANILKTVNVKKPVNVNLMGVAITGLIVLFKTYTL